VGNVLGIEDHKVAGGAQVQAFTYDALDRLLSASASARTSQQGDYSESYTYDGTGNLTSKGGVPYDYDGSGHPHDQPHAVTGTSSGDSFTYDANGNMTTRIAGSDSYTQTWDAENRLVQVMKNGDVVADYVYDGDGHRVQATVNGTTTAYPSASLRAGVGNYLEWRGSPASMVRYYYADGQRIAMRQGAVVYFLLGDHPSLRSGQAWAAQP
jgi:YD repeat-containing protein